MELYGWKCCVIHEIYVARKIREGIEAGYDYLLKF